MNKNVTITKLSGKPGSSIDPGYWVNGLERYEPKAGDRYSIEPVHGTSLGEPFDWFNTSKVISFDGKIITTRNSKWERKIIKTHDYLPK